MEASYLSKMLDKSTQWDEHKRARRSDGHDYHFFFFCRQGADLPAMEIEALRLPVFGEPRSQQESTSERQEGGRVPPGTEEDSKTPQGGEAGVDSRPFVLGEALPVVPAKMVRCIHKGEFDMAELLKDNIEAERRAAGNEAGQGPRVSRQEVPDFESWLQCFSAYAAVICSRYPQKTRELWAYQALMISEHRKCGGRGWLL